MSETRISTIAMTGPVVGRRGYGTYVVVVTGHEWFLSHVYDRENAHRSLVVSVFGTLLYHPYRTALHRNVNLTLIEVLWLRNGSAALNAELEFFCRDVRFK